MSTPIPTIMALSFPRPPAAGAVAGAVVAARSRPGGHDGGSAGGGRGGRVPGGRLGAVLAEADGAHRGALPAAGGDVADGGRAARGARRGGRPAGLHDRGG